jgi:3',5'-cyclic AMP phosphodiesterase CpdA
MRIAHISDSHITPGGSFSREGFSSIVSEINEGPFDIVIHTGDVTDTGLREAYELSSDLLSRIEKPLIVMAGNHDYRNVGYELFEDYFGDLNGVYEGEDYIVIYVDSSIPDRNEGRVGSSKFGWLKEQLITYHAKNLKIVAVHHHLIPVPKAGTERNVLFNAGDLMDLLHTYDVDMVLSGHRHYPHVVNVDGMVISNAGCMSCRKVRGGDICSYNDIQVIKNDITIQINRADHTNTTSNGNTNINNTTCSNGNTYTSQRLHGEIFVSAGKKLTRIVQIAGTFFSDRKIFEQKKFETAVNKINALNPELVVHCGDIVEHGIPQHYNLAESLLTRIKAPVVYTPGPRDINYIGYGFFPHLAGGWEQEFSTELFHAYGVKSSQYDSDVGAVGRFGLKNLENIIKKQKEKMSVVFLHHNVVPLPHIREKGLLEDAGDVLKVFCDLQVDLVLTGHSSYPHATKVNNTIISNTNALSSKYVRSLYGNSFNVIDIYENLINISEIHSLWGTKRILGIWKRNNKIGRKKT